MLHNRSWMHLDAEESVEEQLGLVIILDLVRDHERVGDIRLRKYVLDLGKWGNENLEVF